MYRGDVVAQFDYAVDARGNRTQATETILQPDESTDVHTIGFTYDALSRLLQAQYQNGGGVFRLDGEEWVAVTGRKVAELMIETTGRRWSTEFKEPVIAVLAERALQRVFEPDAEEN